MEVKAGVEVATSDPRLSASSGSGVAGDVMCSAGRSERGGVSADCVAVSPDVFAERAGETTENDLIIGIELHKLNNRMT